MWNPQPRERLEATGSVILERLSSGYDPQNLRFASSGQPVCPLGEVQVLLGQAAFGVAAGLTLIALFLIGASRATVADVRWWRGGLEMLIVGSAAAAVAYGAGALIASVT